MPEHSALLSFAHRQELQRAVSTLENPRLAARIADYAGQPVDRILRFMPRAASASLNTLVRTTIQKCLDVAIDSLDEVPVPPMPWFSSVVAGVAGGVGGAVGLAALPIELPLTTTLMLRSIADIARNEGEDLSDIAARLACVEVFALGGSRSGNRVNLGYYATRALLARLTSEASAYLAERGIAGASAPLAAGFIAEVAARFGVVVSDRVAASAMPVLGALSGATVNLIFMEHFQRVAAGHFTVRRLERHYGLDVVRRHYADAMHQRVAGPGG